MSPSFEGWLEENLELYPEDLTDVSERAAEAILGPHNEYYPRADVVECIDNLRRNQLATQVGLIVEATGRAQSRRAALLLSVAKLHQIALEVLAHAGTYENSSAILTVFRALGYWDAVDIVRGLAALQRGTEREEEVAPSDALAQALMYEPCKLWMDWTDSFPEEPFDPGLQHCTPDTDTGAEFVYRVLAAAGWDVSREDVANNLEATLELVAEWFEHGGQ